jgi:hypothetical protein
MATGGRTKGTRQLFVEIADSIRDRLDSRIEAEQRTLRAVVERALTHYMDTVPVNGLPSGPSPEQPKRGRPRKLPEDVKGKKK